MHLQKFLHLPTRQRHDGHHEKFISRNTGRPSVLKSSVPFALSAAILLPGIAKADPKPVGTWGWTTANGTYIRIRPGQQTPIVGKAARHTQVMVWGTFDGWYRVETTDHKFGWVYHDYITVPKADKLHELSHFKAKKASDAAGRQILYGNPQLLKKYYARYKAPGAKKGLAKQGVTLVSTPKAKPTKAKIVLASTKKPVNRTKVASRPEKKYEQPAVTMSNNAVVTVTTPDTNFAPTTPVSSVEKPRAVTATTVKQPMELPAAKSVETTKVTVPGKAPAISADDIMAARREILKRQPGSRHTFGRPLFKKPTSATAPSQPAESVTATVQPSAMDSGTIVTSPMPIKNGKVTSATPISGEKAKPVSATAINRGGSPRDLARWAQANNRFGDGMAKQALSYRGMPYVSGSASPNRGFDCSGLVYYLLRSRGYNPPRTSDSLPSIGKPVDKSELKRGDIVFFANTYKAGVSHVGVYVGNNKFVHAANSGAGVREDYLTSGYYAQHYWGARRVK